MHADLKNGFQLGPWQVLPLHGEIQGALGSTHLEPKVMEVLVVLARHAGQVVERETLLQSIWGARGAVSDEPLTRCIAALRRALGDSRQAPSYIQTVPKRGYRLISAVAPLVLEQPSDEVPESVLSAAPDRVASIVTTAEVSAVMPTWPRPSLKTAVFAALIVSVALGVWWMSRPVQNSQTQSLVDGSPIARNTIAVLPFVNVDATQDQAYFSEGLADEILNRLNEVDGLSVVARTSSFLFKDSDETLQSIAERLRVAHVLEGSVRRSGEQIRISVQLVDAALGYEIWSESYEGTLDNIFPVQDDIANAVVAQLHDIVPMLVSAQSPITTRVPTENVAAYELLLRGRQLLNRRDEQSLRRSVALFQQAIELDPKYGQPYIELAKAYVLLPTYSSELPDEMLDLALSTLAAGIEQNPSVDQSMRPVMALIAYLRWDWIAAEIAFRSALEHAGNNPDLLVWYSQFLSSVGRPLDSLEQAQRAKEIDLLSPVVNHRLSVALLWADQDDEALRYSRLAEELGMGPTANPDSYIVLMLRSGDYDAVRPMLIGVQTMFAQPTAWVDQFLGALAVPERRAGAVRAIAGAEQARDIARKYLFGAWLYLGEIDRAMATALQLLHDRSSFSVEFLFSREAKALRQHPRFGELVREIGLNRYWDQFGWPEMCSKKGEQIVCS